MNALPTFASRGDLAPLLNKIHHCEALALLKRLPDASVDMVLCDLPYGVTACAWDEIIPLEPMWKELKRVTKSRAAIVLTATQPFTSKLVSSNYEMFKYEWVWDKVNPSGLQIAKYRPMQQHETVLIFSAESPNYYPIMVERDKPKKAGIASSSDSSPLKYRDGRSTSHIYTYTETYPKSILTFSNADRTNRLHPTQKPVALFEYLIKTYTQSGEIVLDMCVGSGTTAVAARNLGRQFICGDITQEYVDMARLRLSNTDPFQSTVFKDGTKQLSLFAEQAS